MSYLSENCLSLFLWSLWGDQAAVFCKPKVYVEPSIVEVQRGQTEQKTSGAVNVKLLLHDQLVRLENDVIETKRKRSFPGSNTPLDRLSISTMDPKSNKQRQVVEMPRRRVSIPIDRIGVGRLPSSRG
uniref:Osteocrin n=1 Tax=Sinocyclocheilus anshuiensis TaxID=1608454 RepID=A0A671MEW6_9TELE